MIIIFNTIVGSFKKGLLLSLSLAFAALLVSSCSSSHQNSQSKIKIVAGENPWGIIASQLGGKYVAVTSFIQNPNADPHLFEASSADAALVAQANIVIINGLGYDTFLNEMLSASGNNPATIYVNQLLGITRQGSNPHLWYKLNSLDLVAKTITNDLVKLRPQYRQYFLKNLSTFEEQVNELENLINQIRHRFTNYPVAYTERVAEYLINEAHLKNLTPSGFANAIENGVSPSPKDIIEMESLITQHKIDVLIYNEQTISKVTTQIQQLAYQNHIKVVGVTETVLPNYNTYYSWQYHQIRELMKALENA